MENSHFTKPHPEYFAEILAHLGRRPEEALVVGDDWSADMVPAARLGMPHFWVTPAGSPAPQEAGDGAHPLAIGDLQAFLDWALATLPDPVPSSSSGGTSPANFTGLPCLLAGNLSAAIGTLAGLPDAAWTRRPGEADWSLTEIVCHLRDVEREVHFPRLQAVIGTDNPFLSGADTDPWAVERDYQSQPGPQARQDFVAARKRTHALLLAQPEGAWQRPARHAILGPTHLGEIVGWILDHDRIHLEQLRTTRERLPM